MSESINQAPQMIGDSDGTELSSQRTALSFDRTALSNDRTLMSILRTALSLIGFGFTIFQFFHKLSEQFLPDGLPSEAPRRFGLALISLGVILLALGIYTHATETHARRVPRQALFDANLIHHTELKQPNSAMIVSVLLLVVGVLAILRVAASAGPF